MKPAEENAARIQPWRDANKHGQSMTRQAVATRQEVGESLNHHRPFRSVDFDQKRVRQ
jgi:hypothetical protein